VITFTTSQADLFAPVVEEFYPSYGGGNSLIHPIINILFDEEINPNNLSEDLVRLVHASSNEIHPSIIEHHIVDEKSLVVLYPQGDLLPDANYRISIQPGIADEFGNTSTSTYSSIFHTNEGGYLSDIAIDDFESGITSNWWDPAQSGSTTGTLSEETSRGANTSTVALTEGSTSAMQLNYGWNTTAGSWLIREYLGGGSPRNVHFTASKTMQAYIFGDGNGNKFRFCVDDNINGSGAHEVSPWFVIDWYGWRLVSWNMATDGTGSWIGDGSLDGTLEFDSIQLTYEPGQPNIGSYIIDELRVVDPTIVDVDNQKTVLPKRFALLDNYPNPFNPMTNIPFTLAKEANVKIKVFNLQGEELALLFSGKLPQGRHETRWNASRFSTGIYLVQMEADGVSVSKKITVLK